MVPGTEPKASHMLGDVLPLKPQPQPDIISEAHCQERTKQNLWEGVEWVWDH